MQRGVSSLLSLLQKTCKQSHKRKYLPWQRAAAESHHVIMVSQGTGWSYHLHLSTGSLQIGQRRLSVGGASSQNGLWPVRGQSVRRSSCDNGLWFARSQGVVTYNWTIERGQTGHLQSFIKGCGIRQQDRFVLQSKFNITQIFGYLASLRLIITLLLSCYIK